MGLAVFFQAKDGCFYPISRIVRIRPVKDYIATIELTGGQEVEVDDFHLDQMIGQTVSSFAAQPETYVISPMTDDPDELYKSPVIGWVIAANGSVRPVTALGINDGDTDTVAVLAPNGTITEYGIADSLEDWKKSKINLS